MGALIKGQTAITHVQIDDEEKDFTVYEVKNKDVLTDDG